MRYRMCAADRVVGAELLGGGRGVGENWGTRNLSSGI